MYALKKLKIYHLILLISPFLLTNCVTNELDLSNGVNTQMTIGGDSLSFPIGKTEPITLGSMLDSIGGNLLKQMGDSTYSLNMSDSMSIDINAIKPVSLNLAPMKMPTINTSVADMVFPQINIDPISLNSSVDVPVVNTDSLKVPGINSSMTTTVILTPPSSGPSFVKSNVRQKAIPSSVTMGPYEYRGSDSIPQDINFTYDNKLNKINNLYLKNSTVTITIDKSDVNNKGFVSQNDSLKSFRIGFPAEYHISNNSGVGTSIEGDTAFVVTNVDMANVNNGVYTASFQIDNIDLSGVPQDSSLNFSRLIKYSFYYKFVGVADTATANKLYNQPMSISVNISATPAMDDLDLTTNDISLSIPGSNSNIDQTVHNLPVEVEKINYLNFKPGAQIQLNIADPGLTPFNLVAGKCTIQLPEMFKFEPTTSGLDTSTNVLTLPYDKLFGQHTLSISAIKINKVITGDSISLKDSLKYSLTDLTLGSTSTKLSVMSGMGTKDMKISAVTSGLDVSDASVTTNKIMMDLPTTNAVINIDQNVSTDVKKLYSIDFESPVQIVLSMSISGMPSSIDSLFFNKYVIQLPSAMKFATGTVNSQNQVILNGGFKIADGFTKTLTLTAFDFGTDGLPFTSDGHMKYSDSVKVYGKAYIKGTTLSSNEIGNITVKPSLSISTINISKIDGNISPAIDPINQSIALSGLPDAIKNDSNNLDIQNPVFMLDVGNTMGIGMNMNISMVPMRAGAPIPDATINTSLSIAPATVLGQYTHSKIWIAKSNKNVPSGYTAVVVPNLPNLLKQIPDSIDIRVTPTVAGDHQIVDLYSPKNAVSVKYSVNVPLNFGADFKIQYTGQITGMKQSLSQVLGGTKQLDIDATVYNGVPLELSLKMKPIDSSGKEITGIALTANDTIHPCDIVDPVKLTTSPSTNNFNIGLKETQDGALNELDGFEYTVSVGKDSTVTAIPLRSDQSVAIELRVRIPKGITIDPSSSSN